MNLLAAKKIENLIFLECLKERSQFSQFFKVFLKIIIIVEKMLSSQLYTEKKKLLNQQVHLLSLQTICESNRKICKCYKKNLLYLFQTMDKGGQNSCCL